MTVRSCCFTIFKFDDEVNGGKWSKDLKLENENVRYVVFQMEKCPKSGLLHVQGYAEFHSPLRFSKIKQIFESNSMHIEKRKGSREQARNYCMKDESRVLGPFEIGEWQEGGQGKRNDIDEAKDFIKNGASIAELWEEFPTLMVKYPKGMNAMHDAFTYKGMRERRIIVFYGCSGSGKTFKAFTDATGGEMLATKDVWLKPAECGNWYDGYIGQKHVILDEIDHAGINFGTFLRITDKYPVKVPIKGLHVNWDPEIIYVTSNKHPADWFSGLGEEQLKALFRRFTEIRRYVTTYEKGSQYIIENKDNLLKYAETRSYEVEGNTNTSTFSDPETKPEVIQDIQKYYETGNDK